MNKTFLTPQETFSEVVSMGLKKSKEDALKVFILGVLGGIFIGLAYVGDMAVMQTLTKLDKGFAKFMGASVFPVGIMLVLFIGGALYTGNNLITAAYLERRIKLSQIFKNWTFVWLGNLVGSILIAFIVYYAGSYNNEHMREIAISMAEHKAAIPLVEAIFSGFLCNVLVALGVWMTLSGRDLASKIIAVWFPVMLFALSGYQHVVANMFCLSLGKILSPEMYSIKTIFLNNLLPVTIGNTLSGGLVIPFLYYLLYGKKENLKKVKEESIAAKKALA